MTERSSLQESPLAGHVDPRYYFPSATHHEALARLHYLVEQNLRIGVLRGPSGCGKTLLLRRLADEVDAHTHRCVRLSLLGLSVDEFLLQLATGLNLNPRLDAPPIELWRRIVDRLQEHRRQQWTTVLICDDAHTASPDLLAAVSRLAEHDPSLDARLTILLSVDERHLGRLGERLLARCALRVDVEPWSTEDTLDFLQFALESVRLDGELESSSPTDFFTPAAAEKLHELSGGIPRRIGQLAQWSLLAGAGLGLEQVDEETVGAAAEELGV